MKKVFATILFCFIAVINLTLTACGNKYVSRYSATVMVRSNTSNEASVSFGSFSGTYVMHLKSNGADEVFIAYEATLREGNIKVYYDYNEEKLNLFEIENNGSVDSKTETFTSNKTIYIILESDGKCDDGSFSFVLEKSEK